MYPIAMTIACAACLLVAMGGYLFGVGRGAAARERLRDVVRCQKEALSLAHRELTNKLETQENGLRSVIEQAIAPLLNRGQIVFDLTTADGGRDLTLLLDKIAEAGDFATVTLSDADGLALAGNSGAADIDRLAVQASYILLMADRIAASGQAAPTSILLADAGNHTTLCRIFEVNGQRVALTAVASGAHLTATSLDPALNKVSRMLAAAAE